MKQSIKMIPLNTLIMKPSFYLLILLVSLTSYSWGQYLDNCSPDKAYDLCKRPQDSLFNSNNGSICLGGNSTFYYAFTTNGAFTWTNPIIKYHTTSSSPNFSSYRIYGPFSSDEDPVLAVATGNAPIFVDAPMINGGNYRQINHTYTLNKRYILAITIPACSGTVNFAPLSPDIICTDPVDCESCIPKFQPVNNKYVISGWVKEENNPNAVTYTNGQLKVTSGSTVATFYGSGQIIDGWQRIEGTIQTNSVGNLKIELISTSGNVYFDDIRVFPYDGSLMTYVYDPKTMRLVAELDERNYAKIYEYDEEGKLIRVKKETEKGIMTIQENRENTSTATGF
jgi:hypothetical protein